LNGELYYTVVNSYFMCFFIIDSVRIEATFHPYLSGHNTSPLSNSL